MKRGGDRVRALPAGQGDDDGRDEDGDRAEGVVEDLQERGPHVDVRAASSPGEDEDPDRIGDQAHDAEEEDRRGCDLSGLEEPAHALDEDVRTDSHQCCRLERGAEDLGAAITLGALGRGGAQRERRSDQRDH